MAVMAAVAIGSSIIQGQQQADASRRAANTQVGAQMAALDEQRRQFDIGQEKLEPFRQAEIKALEQKQALTGLLGADAQRAAIEGISTGPAVQFQKEQAEQALMRQASATGGLGGARVQEALQKQAIGFAQQDLQTQLQHLQGIGAGGTTGQVNLGSQFASQFAQGQENIGQARAGGIFGQAKANQQMVGGIAKGIGQMYGGF